MRTISYTCLFFFIICSFLAGLIAAPKAFSSPLITVNSIEYISTETDTRITIPLGKNTDVRYNRLKNPDRMYIDILGSKIGSALRKKQPIAINGPYIKKIRAAQNRPDRVRIVFYLDTKAQYTISRVSEPFALAVTITGSGKKGRKIEKATTAKRKVSSEVKQKKKVKKISRKKKRTKKIASHQDKKLKQKIIVIDPGHGGKDPGAVGKGGLLEKNVVLDISKRLATIIEKELGCKVILTREKDVFVPIRERTPIAKKNNADLFISIHINADNDRRARGVETYYVSPATSKKTLETAARENMVSINDMEKSDLQFILADLASTYKINESILLASHVQRFLINGLKSKYKNVRNLGVKKGPFYVLADADMPSVLIEAMFITNKEEEKRLRSSTYRQVIARSIFKGVEKYVQETLIALKTE